MNIVTSDITDSKWDDFVGQNSVIDGYWYYSAWLNFLISYGINLEKFCIYDNIQGLVGLFCIEISRLKFASFGYIRGGVIIKKTFKNFDFEKFKKFLYFKSKQLKLHTIRIDNISDISDVCNLNFSDYFPISLAVGLPKYFAVINLDLDEKLLWKNISSSSKNNINKGKRLDFEVEETKNLDIVYKILRETSNHKNFKLPSINYFQKQLELLPSGFIKFFVLSLQGNILSVAVIHRSNRSVFYTYGGSSKDPLLSKYRSQYYLQWYLLTKFKNEGFKEYNMWGVLKDQKSSDLSGVSEFKKNLGAEIKYENTLLEYRKSGVGLLKQIIYDFIVYKKDRI